MRLLILTSTLLILTACPKMDASNNASHIAQSSPTPTTKAETESFPALSPVSPNIKLTREQRKYLNDSLPKEAQEILEKAEHFELLAEVNMARSSETDLHEFDPNRIVRVAENRLKRELLEAFYSDAARKDGPANCYEPHHSIRATYQGKTIEIEICFDCSRFEVKNLPTQFSGTIVREGRKSETLFTRIVEEEGIELKQ